MTDQWWHNTKPGDVMWAEPPAVTEEPEPIRPPAPPVVQPEPETEPAKGKKKALKVAAGVATAVLVGAVLVNAANDSSETPAPAKASPSAQEQFPAAGGGPADDPAPTAEGKQGKAPAAPAPKTVTLSAKAAGKGEAGLRVEITITNNTADTVTVMASMLEADGTPGVVGEGTLSHGAVGPGGSVTGTVEFVLDRAPAQVVLKGINGKIVAASS